MTSGWCGARRRGRLGALLGVGFVGALVAAAGCEPPAGDGGATSITEDPVLGANGLTINGLTTNGLTINGLTINGLTTNGLTINGLAPTSLAALRDRTATGGVTRLFFRYLVSCALPVGHDVAYAWSDDAGVVHSETASGQFALAPAWETGPADVASQEIVSACLFARTNALGMSVPISMRGDASATLAASVQERAEYHYGEGAFWGNAFANPPYGRSCSRSAFDVGTRTSGDTKNGRVCAGQDCGIIHHVGPCYTSVIPLSGQQACFRKALNNDWVSDCSASMSSRGKDTSSRVITTWLRP